MAQLYTDENVHTLIVSRLRKLGHDVLTALSDDKANQGIPDEDVLARSTELGRIVLTNNRRHFHRLHETTKQAHTGIVTFTMDEDLEALIKRIHDELQANPDMNGQLRRVIKPSGKKSP